MKAEPELDWRVEDQIRKAFWESEAAKEMTAKLEPLILEQVKLTLGQRLDRIESEIGSAWLRPVLDKIRESFRSWMDKH